MRAALYRHGAESWRDASLLAAAARDAADTGPLRDLVQAAAGWERPVLPVRGADLAARGIAGPAVGKGLKFVERWWIAQDFRPGREAALEKLEEAIALVRGMGDGAALNRATASGLPAAGTSGWPRRCRRVIRPNFVPRSYSRLNST